VVVLEIVVVLEVVVVLEIVDVLDIMRRRGVGAGYRSSGAVVDSVLLFLGEVGFGVVGGSWKLDGWLNCWLC
jgi:hypothetical protein